MSDRTLDKAHRRESVRVGALNDAETCNRCGGENVVWAAPSPLWNLVMRGNDIEGESLFRDLVRIRCFIVLAHEAGIDPARWRVYADPEPDGLVKITPSGRVWDAERWLWAKPTSPLLERLDSSRSDDAAALADISAIIRDYLTNETDVSSPSLHATAITHSLAARRADLTASSLAESARCLSCGNKAVQS